ncbi:MAG: NAD(P)/FAD-dependent oxidoreductase [Chitinophagales bacterium]
MLQSYKQKYQISDSFDVICIGSGLGSLSAAALLAKEGQKVLVLERHYTAGGFTHIFKRRGYEWDVGIHYIGEMQRQNSILRQLFDYVSDGKLEWADMGEVYDRIVIGDKIYDYVKGTNNFKQKMLDYFPDEAEAISKYVDLVFEATKASRNFYLEKAMPPLVSKVSGGLLRSAYMKFAGKTTLEVMESITNNQELIKVLTGQYGDYGLPPSQSSFAMHATVVRHYFAGGNFPIGGSARIFETILPVITQAGGAVLVSAEVDEILIENNKAVGVRMKDGKEFLAKNIVSGAGIMTTYKKLLPNDVVQKHALQKQLKKVNNSVAHACLYIGFEASPEELQLPKANYWVYPVEGTHDECVERYTKDINAEFPVVYVSFPAAKDPDWSNRYPNKSTVDIITLMPYEIFEQWEGTRWKKRGADYEALKEKISQRLLETLYRLEPQLKGKVAYYELSTPITTQHFINYEKGEIYGLDHSPDRFKNKFLRPHTPIKNLYLTGQDVVSAGVGAALFSGLITASAMTKKNFLKKVMQ